VEGEMAGETVGGGAVGGRLDPPLAAGVGQDGRGGSTGI
jgi:hypothetical protein